MFTAQLKWLHTEPYIFPGNLWDLHLFLVASSPTCPNVAQLILSTAVHSSVFQIGPLSPNHRALASLTAVEGDLEPETIFLVFWL